MLLLYSLNLQGGENPPVTPVVIQQFGAVDHGVADEGGAEKLARVTVANRNKVQAELAEIQRKALELAQKQLSDSLLSTQSTQDTLKTKSNSKTKVRLDFKLQKQPAIAELPQLIINDDFDMELIMAMLAIE